MSLYKPTGCTTCNKVRQIVNPVLKVLNVQQMPVQTAQKKYTSAVNPAWTQRKTK